MTDSDNDDWESAPIPDFKINNNQKMADRKLVEDADNKLTQDLFLDETKHTINDADADADQTKPIKTTLEQPLEIKHKKERYKHIPNTLIVAEQQRNIQKAQERQRMHNKHNDIFGEAHEDNFDIKAAEYDTKLNKYM